jgi:hypothetical protein
VGWFEVERPYKAADKILGPHYGHKMNASGLKASWNQHEETMSEAVLRSRSCKELHHVVVAGAGAEDKTWLRIWLRRLRQWLGIEK